MEYIIGISATFVSIGVSWGIFTTEIKQQKKELEELKNRVESFEKDHDLIIRLDTKVDGINENIKELKNLIENKRQKR